MKGPSHWKLGNDGLFSLDFWQSSQLSQEIRIGTKNDRNNKDAGKADCVFTNGRCGWYEAKGNYLINSLILIIFKVLMNKNVKKLQGWEVSLIKVSATLDLQSLTNTLLSSGQPESGREINRSVIWGQACGLWELFPWPGQLSAAGPSAGSLCTAGISDCHRGWWSSCSFTKLHGCCCFSTCRWSGRTRWGHTCCDNGVGFFPIDKEQENDLLCVRTG